MFIMSSTSLLDLLKAVIEHPKAPEILAILLGFLAVLIGYTIKLRLARSSSVFEKYSELLRQLRTEKSSLIARKQKLIENLEDCTDQLNRAEAGRELMSNELDKCRKALEEVRDTL